MMSDDQLFTASGTFAQQQARLGQLLGLAGPASPDVLASALADREYARNLVLCKDTPVLLDHLLASPPHRAPAGEQHSTGTLLASASKSFWAWTRSGFAVVDEATFQRRFGACRECPDLVEPPRTRLYQVIGADGRSDASKACALCGCVASRKARLPHESCPAPHPELAGMNRWGEPLAGTR
jgi:hypothetical protein